MSARILIVDDVPANLRLLAAKLTAEYFQVECAKDGFEAIAMAGSWLPDLILLDIMMPVMDGYEACRRLKEDANTGHIPVVMVTALGDPAERLRGLEAGADDFLTKPVDYDTLLARVRGLVRLKRLLDEWRTRVQTVQSLGLSSGQTEPPSVAGRQVLIVDDWEPWARAAQASLKLEGLASEIAPSEVAGLDLLERKRFELVVLSLSMVADDPLRLASRLRADPRTSDMPLLLVAEPEQQDRLLRGFDLGASDWLARPVDLNELRVRARNQVRRRLYQDRLRADLTDALHLALVDQMTGLHNRRYLMRHMTGLMASAGSGVAALMIDVDHFKSVNDRWGHRAGDHTLRFVGDILREHTRAFDSLARYGGEEFVIVMPGATGHEAWSAAERLRQAIESSDFSPDGITPHKLTVSVGVARSVDPETTPDKLINAADQALYAAKRGGRNRTVVAADFV